MVYQLFVTQNFQTSSSQISTKQIWPQKSTFMIPENRNKNIEFVSVCTASTSKTMTSFAL